MSSRPHTSQTLRPQSQSSYFNKLKHTDTTQRYDVTKDKYYAQQQSPVKDLYTGRTSRAKVKNTQYEDLDNLQNQLALPSSKVQSAHTEGQNTSVLRLRYLPKNAELCGNFGRMLSLQDPLSKLVTRDGVNKNYQESIQFANDDGRVKALSDKNSSSVKMKSSTQSQDQLQYNRVIKQFQSNEQPYNEASNRNIQVATKQGNVNRKQMQSNNGIGNLLDSLRKTSKSPDLVFKDMNTKQKFGYSQANGEYRKLGKSNLVKPNVKLLEQQQKNYQLQRPKSASPIRNDNIWEPLKTQKDDIKGQELNQNRQLTQTSENKTKNVQINKNLNNQDIPDVSPFQDNQIQYRAKVPLESNKIREVQQGQIEQKCQEEDQFYESEKENTPYSNSPTNFDNRDVIKEKKPNFRSNITKNISKQDAFNLPPFHIDLSLNTQTQNTQTQMSQISDGKSIIFEDSDQANQTAGFDSSQF